ASGPVLAGLLHQPRGDLGEHLGPVGVEDLLRAEVADRPVVGLPEPGQDVVAGAHAASPARRCSGSHPAKSGVQYEPNGSPSTPIRQPNATPCVSEWCSKPSGAVPTNST